MNLKIAVLAGDGIGPEIMKQGVAVLNEVADKFNHKLHILRLFAVLMLLTQLEILFLKIRLMFVWMLMLFYLLL